ncbi:DoxX family protein [Paenibacillus sp. 1011MAR3C5]|uniref:DoxX family membrane protein n=1 Tax=Paenibacillus sp. 1011MAR3C5 TaxID=1675787 RepID=UPI000E6B9929|nr:DoxX family protein [Paenibacillus sp. 1011MAR3C5]RJE88933.1 DoxX family protein [Paenibacillus sp. 1011MAR3C5]
MKFWSEKMWSAFLVTFIRIFLGYNWLMSGWGKLSGDQPFDASGFLNNALANPVIDRATGEALYPAYLTFLEHVALPQVKLINILVPWGEFLVGLGLIVGALSLTAAFFGLLLNFMFMFSGSVSNNPWFLLLGILIILAGSNTGRFGVDRYLLPWLKDAAGRLARGQRKTERAGTGM